MTTTLREPLGLKFYRRLSEFAEPIADFTLKLRVRSGKEDAERLAERRGEPSVARPVGNLVWVHGVSVGESLSVIPFVERMREMRPELNFLVTTGTITSAALMRERLPGGAIHQYIPLDHPHYVQSFLEHWRPDAAVFVESEFWPNLILATRKITPYMALVNGRISPNSFDGWRRQPNSIKFILSSFDTMIAQDPQNGERLSALTDTIVPTYGNLKHAAPPLPVDDAELTKLSTMIGQRPCWLAASTHPGEEEKILDAHNRLREKTPDILTIIAPRHPGRGAEVNALLESRNISFAQRAKGDSVADDIQIYLADTLGELGLFYRLCDIAFVGGSFAEKGGHNPLEPARLNSAILHGPNIFNFVETYSEMRKAGAAALVRNDLELANAVRRLMSDAKTRTSMVDAARESAEQNAEAVLGHICTKVLDGFDEAVKTQ